LLICREIVASLPLGQEGLDAQALVERIAERFGRGVHRRTVERAVARLKKKR
jgi:hypothetical protein